MTLHPPSASSPPPLSAPAQLSVQSQWLVARPAGRSDSSLGEHDADASACGMPAERLARLAAQRAFVALKLSFLYVVDSLAGQPDLQRRVRLAEEPHDLWALRGSVFAALTGGDAQHRSRRQLLNRSLDTMFPSAAQPLN